MGRKNKNKPKKVSAKREKYKKFHKEKPGTVDISMPELTEEQMKQKREDESRIDRFLRYNRNPPAKEVIERRMKDKR
ncbi:hypothetical protein GF323_01415 [Candidatus Woesearchaeota archaeon]|nr:hypothetical protein [Candidatus Woesearchaeota archaeon]